MITLTAIAEVTYCCTLNEADTNKVLEYMTKNECDLDTAVKDLYNDYELDIYHDSIESDFHTMSIDDIEESDD